MNKKLISNPFLFPPSGDNEEEKQLFQVRADIIKDYITYSIEEFEKAWREQGENRTTTEERIKGDLFPIPLSSPTISSTEPSYNVMDLINDESFSPFDNDCDLGDVDPFWKEQDSQKSIAEFLRCTDSVLNSDEMFSATNGIDINKQSQDFMSSQGSNLSGMSEAWVNNSFQFFEAITADDPIPPLSSINCVTANPVEVHQAPVVPLEQEAPTLTTPVKVEPVSSPARPTRPSRQRRKSVQTSRNVEDSPMAYPEESMELTSDSAAVAFNYPQEQDVKPFALAALNGTSNRTRNPSTSSAKSMATVSSSAKARKESQERRKRKYEEEDDNDPSVKNAKAAKLNREKKKQQLSGLQTENTALRSKVQNLEQENEDLRSNARLTEHQKNQEIERLQLQLTEERSKNSGNAFTGVRMLGYITNIVHAMQPAPQVYVTQRLADMPAPTTQELALARGRMMGGEAFQNDNSDNYLTVKVGLGGSQPSLTFDCENSSQL